MDDILIYHLVCCRVKCLMLVFNFSQKLNCLYILVESADIRISELPAVALAATCIANGGEKANC